MERRFASKRDIIRAFAGSMNLISSEVENHHEKVSFLAYRLADILGMDENQKKTVFYAGLLHDIGGVLQHDTLSLTDLEANAQEIVVYGAAILKQFPVTAPYAPVVLECQTPWHCVDTLPKAQDEQVRLGQIVHLADVVTLLMEGPETTLNRAALVSDLLCHGREREFSPESLEALRRLSGREDVWLEMMVRPECYQELIPDNHFLSLDDVVAWTRFMSQIIDFRSPFTAMHSAGVAATAAAIAELSGMSERECKMMRIAGYLHDIGKLKIPDEVLEKPGKLSGEEFNIMKEHAYYTWVLLKDIAGFEQIADWAAHHHEKLNGKGYPFHLYRNELSLGARIMTIADIFSALAEDRPYRKGMEKEKVLMILREDAQNGFLSDKLVALLTDHYDSIDSIRNIESRAASKAYQESLKAGNSSQQ
jgi:putative nucleotidyltransferase with HDIG domain